MHAPRVRAHVAVAGVREVEDLEQCPSSLRGALPAEVVEASDELEILEAGEVLVHRRVLAGEPDALAHLTCVLDDVEPGHSCCAVVRAKQRRQDADGRRLARSVGAEEPVDGARLHVQVDAFQRLDLAVVLPQACCVDRARVRHWP